MPAISNLNHITATLYGSWTGNGRPWQISWHYFVDTPGTFSSELPQAAYTVLESTITADPDWNAAFSVGVICTALEITSPFPPGYYPFGGSCQILGTGGSGDMLPEGTGPLCLFDSGFPSVAFPRPSRLYWPGCNEGQQEQGAISQTFVDNLTGAWAAVRELSFTIDSDPYTLKHVQLAPSNPAKDSEFITDTRIASNLARVVRRQRVYQGRS